MHCLSFFFFFFFNDTATTEIYTLSLHDALPIWRSGRSCWREMTRVLLVPDLPLERWPSMDRYAHRLYEDRKSTRLNSSHSQISYAVFCLKKKTKKIKIHILIACISRTMSVSVHT